MNECQSKIPFKLKCEVVSVIMDTGFLGNAETYVQQFYGKSFDELTTYEAEMIVATLKNKPGCPT